MNRFLSLAATIVLICASCSDNDIVGGESRDVVSAVPTDASDRLNVKLSEDIVLSIDNTKNTLTVPTGNSRLDDYLGLIGATSMKRVFAYSERFEKSMSEDGLNRWYTVCIDTCRSNATRAVMLPSGGVTDVAEPVHRASLGNYKVSEVDCDGTRAMAEAPYNDPFFGLQWGLSNSGVIGNYTNSLGEEIVSSVAGGDINVAEAWQQTTGEPDVIISEVDGGIDINHEDLKGSLWVNKGEIPGNGIDDDGNGYVDDVYGYNFVDDTGTITPVDHGTHVAGIMAARNNNSKGICGVAGGNGTELSGARIMSCQIFKVNPDYAPNDPDSPDNIGADDNAIAAAIVYGANNGAVISQNSWGYGQPDTRSKVVEEAITYFNVNAGNYDGAPMKGGVAIFAAGNSGRTGRYYPAALDNVISVSSYAPDLKAAYYTVYDNWVDICAPGGSAPVGYKYPRNSQGIPCSEIVSTLPVKDGKSMYGYMQGTSMACPHVSGVAALVVSKYGGSGFVRDDLWRHLMAGIKGNDINAVNAIDGNKYADRLGLGYIDAAAALATIDESVKPMEPSFDESLTHTDFTSITLGWNARLLEEGQILKYTLYYSASPFTADNITDAKVARLIIPASGLKEGAQVVRTLSGLPTGTRYYAALTATARSGRESAPTFYGGMLATTVNHAPEVSVVSGGDNPIHLAGNDMHDIVFRIDDAEGQQLAYSITDRALLNVERSGNNINVRVFASRLQVGEKSFTLTVNDIYGATATAVINVVKTTDNPPVVKTPIEPVGLARGETCSIDLRQYVDDEYSGSLTFAAGNVTGTNVSTALNGYMLKVTALGYGQARQTFEVTDCHNQKVSFSLDMFVYMDKGIYSLFPTTAENTVYVKLGTEVTGKLVLCVRNAANKLAIEKSYDTAQLDALKRTIMLDVSSLYPGQYTVSIENGGKTYKEKFIKK